MEEEEARGMAGLSLRLGLGGEGGGDGINGMERQRKPSVQFHVLFPTGQQEEEEEEGSFKGGGAGASSSSSSLRFTGGRRGRRIRQEEEEEDARDQSSSSARKKLRLSKEQSTLLEDHFRRNTTLNLNQKMELARRLNLQPRQIEVWFQNRRARTKLKQTEVDCGFLRKYCDKISDENRRLKAELMELRSKINSTSALCATASPSPSLYMKNLAYMCCPSCKKPPVLDPSATLAPPCGETKTVNFMAAKAKSGSCESETSFDIPSSSGATTTTIVNHLPWAWSSLDEDSNG